MKASSWEHFTKESVTILDRRVMKALAIKAGVRDKSNNHDIKYSGYGLFYYKGRWFIACGYSQKTRNTSYLTDIDGYIGFCHIALCHFDIQRYRDIVEQASNPELEILGKVGYRPWVWRVFKFLFEQTRWKRQFPTVIELLKESIRIADNAAHDSSYEKTVKPPVEKK